MRGFSTVRPLTRSITGACWSNGGLGGYSRPACRPIMSVTSRSATKSDRAYSPTTSPSRRIETRSHSVMISSSLWVMNTQVRPSSRRPADDREQVVDLVARSEDVGSSRTSTSGRAKRARRSSPAAACACSGARQACDGSSGMWRSARNAAACDSTPRASYTLPGRCGQLTEHDVLGDRQRVDDRGLLRDDGDAHPLRIAGRLELDDGAGDPDRALERAGG